MTRLPTRRGIGAPRRRGVRLPTAANVPQATPRSDPGVTVPAGAFGNGLALADLGAAIGDVGETIRKEERKRAAEEALKEAARRREEQKSKGADELEQPPKPELKPEAPPESEPLSSVEDDVRAVKLRDVALNARMNDVLVGGEGSEGYLSSQGEAAMAAYGPTRQALIALAEDYLGQVGNERVRRKLEPVAAARVQGNLAAAKRHRDAQRPVAENDASNARIDNAFADATGRPDDPGAILQAQAVVYDETLQIAEREGKNEEEARHAANNAVGRLHTGVVEALVDRDPSAAHAYLATNRDAVAPSARAELDALVQDGLIPVVAEPVAREIHANGGTPDERRRAAARYVEHDIDSRIAPESIPEFRHTIARWLERLDAEDAAQTRTKVDKANEVVREVVDAGGDVDDAPATARRTLRQHDPESLEVEAEVAAKRRRGEDTETDVGVFSGLVEKAALYPEGFVGMVVPKSRSRLSSKDFAFIKDLQDKLRAGGETAERTGAFLRNLNRKASAASPHAGENPAETFYRFVTDVRDLQHFENRQATATDMNRLLMESSRGENEGPSALEDILRYGSNSLSRGMLANQLRVQQYFGEAAFQRAEDLNRSLSEIISEIQGPSFIPGPEDIVLGLYRYSISRFGSFVGEDAAAAAQYRFGEVGKLRKRIAETEFSPIATEFQTKIKEAGKRGLGPALEVALDDPVGALITGAEISGESIPQLVIAVLVAAATRNPAMVATMTGTTSAIMERYEAPAEFLARNGFDLSNEEDVVRFLSDPEMVAEAKRYGFTRGSIVGAFDAISGRVAGMKLMKDSLSDILAKVLARIGLGGGGEVAAQLATDGSVDWAEVVLEVLSEFAGVSAEAVSDGGTNLSTARYVMHKLRG